MSFEDILQKILDGNDAAVAIALMGNDGIPIVHLRGENTKISNSTPRADHTAATIARGRSGPVPVFRSDSGTSERRCPEALRRAS